MPEAMKLAFATQSDVDELKEALVHLGPGEQMRWFPDEFDAGAPDWCCPACARKILIGAPPKTVGLMLECGDCHAVGIVPPLTAWPARYAPSGTR